MRVEVHLVFIADGKTDVQVTSRLEHLAYVGKPVKVTHWIYWITVPAQAKVLDCMKTRNRVRDFCEVRGRRHEVCLAEADVALPLGIKFPNIHDFNLAKARNVRNKAINPRPDINVPSGIAFVNQRCNQEVLVKIMP